MLHAVVCTYIYHSLALCYTGPQCHETRHPAQPNAWSDMHAVGHSSPQEGLCQTQRRVKQPDTPYIPVLAHSAKLHVLKHMSNSLAAARRAEPWQQQAVASRGRCFQRTPEVLVLEFAFFCIYFAFLIYPISLHPLFELLVLDQLSVDRS